MDEKTSKTGYLRGISVNVLLLGVVSFFNDVSSEMIMPTLPMFVSSLGGTVLAVGILGGIRDSVSSILNIFAGYWSDRTGRRKIFVFSGYLISTVFKFFLALSKVWPQAVFLASAERLGKGLRGAARDAIIAESMVTQEGKGFGVHRAFDTFGAIVGSLIVFLLYWFFNVSFKFIILASAAVSFASLVPIFFVKETVYRQQQAAMRVGFRNLPSQLKLFILVSAVFALGNFSYMFFIIRAQQFFTGRLSIAMPLLLYVFFNIFYAIFSIPLGVASDKFGRGRIIIFGYLLFALVCFGFAFFTSLPAVTILFALYGITFAAIESSQRAFVADLSLPAMKGTAMGTFHTVVGLMALPAGIIAGTLWGKISPHITFIYGGVLGAVASLLFAVVFRNYTGSKKVG